MWKKAVSVSRSRCLFMKKYSHCCLILFCYSNRLGKRFPIDSFAHCVYRMNHLWPRTILISNLPFFLIVLDLINLNPSSSDVVNVVGNGQPSRFSAEFALKSLQTASTSFFSTDILFIYLKIRLRIQRSGYGII